MATSSAPARSLDLRILTLNVWGLKFVSKKRRERIKAIAEYICLPASDERKSSSSDSAGSSTPLQAASQPKGQGSRWDVVCLQEVWCSEDWQYLQNRARQSGSGLKYGHYFWSGALGSGLCILSKYPIVATSTWPYSMNGSPLHVIEGDFFVAKSCGQATLDLGPGIGLATVLNTHMFAPGGDYGNDWKGSHRLTQAWELARLANVAAERGQHVFVCGDLNSLPTSLIINLLLSHGRLSDSWAAVHPPAEGVTSDILTAEEAITVNGITCDNPLNTWSASKSFSDEITRAKGKRLDYILYRRAERHKTDGKHYFKPVDCSVAATDIPQGLDCSYSDHFGVSTLFSFAPYTDDETQSEMLVPARPTPRESITLASAAITVFSERSIKSAQAQLSIFGGALVGIPVLAIAASFQPLEYLNWIFVLLGIVNGAIGATMLYTGFVGGKWEMSAVKNVLRDMQVELDRLEAAGR